MRATQRIAHLIAVVLAAAAPAAAAAAFGDVDTSFGDQGSAALIGPPGAFNSVGAPFVIPDAVGFGLIGDAGDGRKQVIADVRHQADGSLVATDPTRRTPIGLGSVNVSAVMPTVGGGTLVGLVRHTGLGATPTIVRMLADRTLDPAWGSGGIVTLPGRGGRVDLADLDAGPGGTVVVTLSSEGIDGIARGHLVRLLPSGAPDPGFGAGGTITLDLGVNDDEPRLAAAAVDPASGTVTVAANTSALGAGTVSVLRFLGDGGVDPSFGGGDGRTDFFGGAALFTIASEMALDPSGRPVIVGTRFPGTPSAPLVMRLTTAGTPDATFDLDGVTTLAVPNALSGARGNRMLVDGLGITLTGPANGFAIAPASRPYIGRLLATGAVDPAFGGGDGVADYAVDPTFPNAMAIVAGRIVVAGVMAGGSHAWLGVDTAGTVVFSGNGLVGAPVGGDVEIFVPRSDGGVTGVSGLAFAAQVRVASVLASGAPDAAFGGGTGASLVALPASGNTHGAARAPDGAIVAVGDMTTVPVGGFVGRFRPDGAPDPAFGGGDGLVTVIPPAGTLRFRDVLVAPDGAIVAAARGTAPAAMGVHRFLSDGSPDPTFGGGDGVAALPGPAMTEAHSVARTSGGAIVVVGSNAAGVVVVRLLGDGSPDGGFATGGVLTAATTENVYAGAVDGKDRTHVTLGDGPTGDARVLRLTAAGVPDPAFGTAGFVSVAPTRAGFRIRLQEIAVLADDAVVAGAVQFPLTGGMTNIVAVRIDPSGGVVTRDALLVGLDAVAALPDGRFYIGGNLFENHAVRLLGSPPAAPSANPVVTEQSIRLDATADAAGFTSASVIAEGGPTTGYGSVTAPAVLAATQGPQTVGLTLAGLTPGALYHVRAVTRNASGTTPGADIAVRTARRAPVARITLPRRNRRTVPAAWRVLRGTAVDPAPSSGIARVELNLYRRSGKRCIALTRVGLRRITCRRALVTWVRAPGTTKWTRRVPKLARGQWVLRARAIDKAGVRQTRFTNGRNRLILRLR